MDMTKGLVAEGSEKAVLGSLVQDPTRLALVRPVLPEPAMFLVPAHRDIYRAALLLSDTHQPLDLLSLGRLVDSGSLEALEAVGFYATDATDAEGHARTVRDAHLRRVVAQEADRLKGLVGDVAVPVAEAVGNAVAALARHASGEAALTRQPTVAQALFTVMERLEKPDHGIEGLPTGIERLDLILGGIQPGLHIVAGNPGEGKTALAMLMARTAADHGAVLFNSLEMTTEQLVERSLSAEAGVNLKWVRQDQARLDKYAGPIAQAAADLARLPLTIDQRGTTPGRLRLAYQGEVASGRTPRLIVVDYLQLMKPDTRETSRDREMGEITRALKLMSMEFSLPIVLLSQLNRDSKKSQRAPDLHDLRDSGNIEQDADTVTILHYPQGRAEKGPQTVDLLVRKNRHGPVGTVPMLFQGWRSRWVVPGTLGREESVA